MSNTHNTVKEKVYIPIMATALLGVALMVIGIVMMASC